MAFMNHFNRHIENTTVQSLRLIKVQKHDILTAIDNYQSVILVLLDLSSAFDTIDHNFLLHRLNHRFGICDKVLEWFGSYLSHRTQFVKLNGGKSDSYGPLFQGVPQRSVPGPILYLLYTSSVGDIARRHNISFHFYTDDIQLYITFQTSNLSDIEACVRDIDLWMLHNKLKLNKDKTELLVLSSKYRLRPSLDTTLIDNEIVPCSSTARNVGVYSMNQCPLFRMLQLSAKLLPFICETIIKFGNILTMIQLSL